MTAAACINKLSILAMSHDQDSQYRVGGKVKIWIIHFSALELKKISMQQYSRSFKHQQLNKNNTKIFFSMVFI